MQDSGHKKASKQEMKIFTMYEGWDADSPKRSRLVNKKMLAGMEKSDLFHQKREALIEKVYDAEEIRQRILNGDGGSWIKETYDPDAIFQLDRFHIYKEIKKKSGRSQPGNRSGNCWRKRKQIRRWSISGSMQTV